MRLRSIVNVSVSSGSLGTSKLYRKSSMLLVLELRLLQIESNSPVVDIAIADVLFWARVVTPSAKDTPMNVVEIFANIALTNLEIDTIREILDEVPVGPVDTVLFRLQRLGCIEFETMTVFTGGLVRSANSPNFLTS